MALGHIEKGAFHKWLGQKAGEPISGADIKKGLAAGGHAAKMANFARNAKHFDHSKSRSQGRATRMYGKAQSK
jgi:hypothetical protein